MNSEEAVAHVILCLESCQIDYMIVGALSCNLYGVPRASMDADIVVDLSKRSLRPVLEQLGADFKSDPQVAFELLTGSHRNVVHFLPTGFDIELFHLGNDEHHRIRFERKVAIELPELGRAAQVQTAEDLIIQKLRWARRKDLDDIVNVLTISAAKIDWSYIWPWTEKHETKKLLNELRIEAGCSDSN